MSKNIVVDGIEYAPVGPSISDTPVDYDKLATSIWLANPFRSRRKLSKLLHATYKFRVVEVTIIEGFKIIFDIGYDSDFCRFGVCCIDIDVDWSVVPNILRGFIDDEFVSYYQYDHDEMLNDLLKDNKVYTSHIDLDNIENLYYEFVEDELTPEVFKYLKKEYPELPEDAYEKVFSYLGVTP